MALHQSAGECTKDSKSCKYALVYDDDDDDDDDRAMIRKRYTRTFY